MKVLIFLADGFEDTEFVATRDVLMRSGLKVDVASISNRHEVVSSFGLTLRAGLLLSDIRDVSAYDALILPGGGRGTRNLLNSPRVRELVQEGKRRKILLAAICAAPSVLGAAGVIDGQKFTCFPGFQGGIKATYTGAEIETDERLITGRSMAYAEPFALKIIEYLLGRSVAEKVRRSTEGLGEK